MYNIFRIFHNDLRTIYRNIIALVVIIGISILPALYSWFNIASNWDPYSATGGISFAVCNKDVGYQYQSIEVNAGQQIVDKLKSNTNMGWDFVDEKAALDGVNNGKYYAAVIIPEKFSENLCSLTTGAFTRSTLDYYVNEKKNAIAPKITNSGINTITNEVKLAYVSTVTNLLATMLNITAETVDVDREKIVSEVTASLNNISTEVDAFNTTCDVFISTLNVLKQLVETNKKLLPTISDTLSKSGVITSDIKQSIESTRKASESITNSVADIVSSASEMQKTISAKLDEAFEKIDSNASDAAGNLIDLSELVKKVMNFNDQVISILNTFQESFGIDVSSVVTRLSTINDREQTLIDKLYAAAETLTSTGELPATIKSELTNLINASQIDFSSAEASFNGLKSSINKTVDDMYSVLESASGMLQLVNGDIPDFTSALDSSKDTMDQMITSFENTKNLMNNSKTKISNLIATIQGINSDNELGQLVLNIIEDPKALSTFFSEPVLLETHRVYSVENYGSAMSPFYTSLGIWVGGIVLIAIIRVELKRKQFELLKRPKNYQMYLGRYLVFFLISQIQALIISLGDIYFLGIQCNNKFLFVLGSMISAFVYSLLIYSLTISFNVIGKALAVIILVLQVAGSGGTFPLEVLPEPFRNIAPFLPFKYGVNILREAIAGPDMGSYWYNVSMLMLFVPLALLIGLFLRAPCIRLMHFLDKRIHQSDLII